MTQEKIKAIMMQALASLSGIEGVSSQMIEAAATTAASSVSTEVQSIITERDELQTKFDTVDGEFQDFKATTKDNQFKTFASALKIPEKALTAFKAYMSEEDLEGITDIKSASAAFAKAAKASGGTLAFEAAKGTTKAVQQSASPFDQIDTDDEEDDQDEVSDEAEQAAAGAGLGG